MVGLRLAAETLICATLLTGCAMTQRAIPSTMSDASVMSLFDSIDKHEIQGAQVARERASSQIVRDYADRLVHEHSGLLMQKQALADRIHMEPQQSALTSRMEAANQKMLADLTQTSGLDFDRAYLDYQLALHNEALDIVEETAIEDPQLKEELLESRPDLLAHAAKARSLRQQLPMTSARPLSDR
jgi:putative membrane protein